MKPRRFYFRTASIFGVPLKMGVPVFIGFSFAITGLTANAGDILRGGSTRSNKPTRANGGTPTPAATDAARANAKDTLARTSRTLKDIRNLQNAARNAAIRNGSNNLGKNPNKPNSILPRVPNGIAIGGLNPSADPTKWTGAKGPVQRVKNGKTTVTIKQTTQQALLEWQTMNVGKKTTLTFDQSKGGADSGKWIAFNQIKDTSGNPTQILGNIKADGQIYLINTNGIIFGGSSQVNAKALTASSLPINTNLIERGILNNPDAQFLFSGLAIPAGANGTPAFVPDAPLTADGRYGDVVVRKGAVLKSPTNSAKVGGRITLVGPNVTNGGTISTPDGQAILASGLQVGFDGHSASDASLRGLDVFVGAVADPLAGAYAGTTVQSGIIEAERGNITLTGKDIRQDGTLVSTTSVSLNGRIDIQASYGAVSNRTGTNKTGDLFLFKNTGSVSLGEGSLISVLPEYDSKEKTIGTELALRSQVNIKGKTIHVGVDSIIHAPNAIVNLAAGTWFYNNTSNPPTSTFVQTGGQVYLEDGALIDVAGSLEVSAPVSQNIVSVDLRGAELAGSPLQRDGKLRNVTIEVDIRDVGIYQGKQWLGTPLADIAGFANLIQRSVGQLTVAGGTVNISAGKSVVMNKGSRIDVSGGSTKFEAGMIRTTRLLTKDGRLVDISDALPDVVYDGIYDGTFDDANEKFGISRIYHGALAPDGYRRDPGSTEGAAGGKLSISAPSMVLDGKLEGRTIVSEKQRAAPPKMSELSLSFQTQDISYPTLPFNSPTPPVITFSSNPKQESASPFSLDANGDPADLAASRTGSVVLSTKLLSKDGFGILTVDNHDGAIIVEKGVKLDARTGGSITLKGSNITIDGSVSARGGSLSFSTNGLTLDEANLIRNSTPAGSPAVVRDGRGIFTLGSSGSISTAGLVVDDRLTREDRLVSPVSLNGGSVKIEGYSVALAEGGKIDVSGGASLGPTGSVTYGNGGSISLAAGREPGFNSTLGGKLTLGAALLGRSGSKAGSLSLTGPAFQVGGPTAAPGVTLIRPGFFSQGGFGSINLTGIGLATSESGVYVPGVLISGSSRIIPTVEGSLGKVGKNGTFNLTTILRKEGVRTPVNLTFGAIGATYGSTILTRGDVVMEEGAVIRTDAKGTVTFNAQTVTLHGSVVTAGGSITVTGAPSFPTGTTVPTQALPTVHLSDSAVLSARGAVLLVEDPFGLRQGQVLAGGTISISGNIVAEDGAVLDVSGTKGVLDVPPSAASLDSQALTSLGGKTYVPVTIESNGGTINLTGGEMLFSDATLIGKAGGKSATGGTANVSSGRFLTEGMAYTTADANLIVTQGGNVLSGTNTSVGTGVLDVDGKPAPGLGHFAIDRFSKGGFDSLSLGGNVRFAGKVSIKMPGRLSVGDGGVIYADSNVSLTAGHVVLGQAFRPPTAEAGVVLFTQGVVGSNNITPYYFGPEYGAGKLTVKAGLIDVGDLSLHGIGTTRLIAKGGDVRGNGTFQMAGDLFIRAGQIYPTTQGDFGIFVYDHVSGGKTIDGTVSIKKGGQRSLPFSAGGSLSIYASEITQGGTLRAPIGTINLGWDGSGPAPVNTIAGKSTDSPVTDHLTLESRSVTSVTAIDPVTKDAMILPYGISPDGTSWIDPSGNDITTGGAPEKKINLGAVDLTTEKNSTVDIRGGGDLYAYRWISGNGGKVDILSTPGTFAVIPGYGFDYAPYAPFGSASSLGGQPGYVDSTLKAGDKITLAGGKDLPAGTYTLLPARYALLPGAFLITPQGGSPVNSTTVPEGASIVSGYRSNNLDDKRTGATAMTRYEVASAKVLRARAEYQDLLATTVLKQAAIAKELAIPRLPTDAGYLSFSSSLDMSLEGKVRSGVGEEGRGSMIDINSSSDILINGTGRGGSSGQLVLNASQLNEFGAESLLIGGLRALGPEGATVTVNTGNLEVVNKGTPLAGSDIILVSDTRITLGKKSQIKVTSSEDAVFDTLLLGDEKVTGSGNGALVRVSANASGGVSRFGVGGMDNSRLALSGRARLEGGGIVMDSTSATDISSTARLNAEDISLSSGRISIRLDNPGKLNPDSGLVLSGNAFSSLQASAKRLALVSYSTLDVYGRGAVGNRNFESLSLQAAAIRGFNTGSGSATFSASNLIIGNSTNTAAGNPLAKPLTGSLNFDADNVTLTANAARLDGYADVTLSAADKILFSGEGSLDTAGDLNLRARLLTGDSASKYRIESEGFLRVNRQATGGAPLSAEGFGADLTLEGSGVRVNGDITLPSGKLTLHATTGDVIIGGNAPASINLEGTSVRFVDAIRYTSGGSVNLSADKGSVILEQGGQISVAARPGGGNAGVIHAKTPEGRLILNGSIDGSAGTKGLTGLFSLDTGALAGGSLANLDTTLDAGDFTYSREYRIRNGDVEIDGDVTSHIYRVIADSGDIVVSSTIDASGNTGGTIDLKANGSLVLRNGSVLDASGRRFDSAGKGGMITLEAGNQRNGVIDTTATLDLRTGSRIDLSVAAADSKSESLGQFTGKLHLRAPRTASNNEILVEAIGSNIRGASSILVEGVKLYGVTGTGTITTAIQNSIRNESTAFLGAAGVTTAAYTAMMDRLTSLKPGLDIILAPGAEIYNSTGDIVLGSTTSTSTSDWNLQTYRFGAKSAPGVLTLRATGDIVFYNALSDGFSAVTANAASGQSTLWLAPLMGRNELLPANTQSWSYRFTSGADLSSADFGAVLTTDALTNGKGSFLLGKNYGNAATFGSGADRTTAGAIANRYQVIRTGSGDIDINSARNAYILNQFASIYSAGTVVSDPTSVIGKSDFVMPVMLDANGRHPQQGNLLGAIQQSYAVQYSMAGGNISLKAEGDIARMTRTANTGLGGTLIDDSTRQLPNNWLYRRGYIDPVTGESGEAGADELVISLVDPDASTTWWVDFSNFFQGVGTLGGGNILLSAGNDVKNIDAVAPTNARMAGGKPSASRMVELGGGDITVLAGRNIDGGVYYVERGHGKLEAGSAITTNSTRSPSRGIIASLTNPIILDSHTWLPTTLFVGKGGFDVQAGGDLLLGPVANPFLLPQGLDNKFWYKTYFNTYAPDSYVNAVSLGGSVTHRTEAYLTAPNTEPLLGAWMRNHQSLTITGGAALYHPWLRLAETTTSQFAGMQSIMAPTLRSTALSGKINLAGDIVLFPSAVGQLDLLAKDSISGLQPTGVLANSSTLRWVTSTINVSDADPSSIPGITTPYSYLQVVGRQSTLQRTTGSNFLKAIDGLFSETGSTNGALEVEQGRHTAGGLHRNDKDPVRVFAVEGNIDGFNLFTPKQTRVIAGRDIGDVGFYFQNLNASDISLVSAGRDLIAYNAGTLSRNLANADITASTSGQVAQLSGDIQIAGPGNLQVLAGRTLDLGLGSANADGTGTGITSIGNGRNPYLPFQGAGITVGAGVGPAASLASGNLDFAAFIKDFVDTKKGAGYLKKVAPGVDFDQQSPDEQARIALEIFYLTLRDTGRDFNDPDSPGYQKWQNGYKAIRALFPKAFTWGGEILTQSRDIRTRSGGDINIFAPGGGLTMANTTIGNPLTPPGIVTESGGDISIFTRDSVNIGIGRIFTLRGGNALIWSSKGDIAAGTSSRTVSAAPPTRVIIDPQSGSVETDLAGLATGGGIGVLATVEGVKPGDVDLIAPTGIIDAGDAGIRVSGNINLAAVTVVNVQNIQAGGTSTGTPSAGVSTPSISTVTAASNATAATDKAAVNPQDTKPAETAAIADSTPSLITVEVIGYGGGSSDEEEDEEEQAQ